MAAKRATRRYADHPIVRYVRSMEGELYLSREVCAMVDCSASTLVYLPQRSGLPLGPSHQAQYGSIPLHLYDRERIDEIARYLKQFRASMDGRRHGPKEMWTRTEQTYRFRERVRAQNFRKRAKRYLADGEPEKAARLLKKGAAITAELEQARAKRWIKVHGRPRKPKE